MNDDGDRILSICLAVLTQWRIVTDDDGQQNIALVKSRIIHKVNQTA